VRLLRNEEPQMNGPKTIESERFNHRLVIYSKATRGSDLQPQIAIKSPRPLEFGPGGDLIGRLLAGRSDVIAFAARN